MTCDRADTVACASITSIYLLVSVLQGMRYPPRAAKEDLLTAEERAAREREEAEAEAGMDDDDFDDGGFDD